MKLTSDIRDVFIGEEGVENFYYPSLPQKDHDFDTGVLNLLSQNIALYKEFPLYQDAFKIAGKYIAGEIIGVFQAEKAINTIKLDRVDLSIRTDWDYWHSTLNQIPFKEYMFLKAYRDGPNRKQSFFKKILDPKFLRRFLASQSSTSGSLGSIMLNSKFRYGPLTSSVLKTSIVSSERSPLMLKHSLESQSPVYFNRLYHLFSPVTESQKTVADQAVVERMTKTLLTQCSSYFTIHGQRLHGVGQKYLNDTMSELILLLYVHLHRLESLKDKLPSTLWIGTCGDRWNSLIASAVRRAGGKVIAHDHSGVGFVTMPVHAFIESSFSDEFITFSEGQAEGYRNETGQWDRFGTPPRISGLSNDIFSYEKIPHKKMGKKIVYVTTIFEKDRGRVGQTPPDIIRVDIQARIIQHLLSQGYEVILKPHPESKLDVPEWFSRQKGLSISTEPFTVACRNGDYLIFDYLHTSAFKEAIHTDLPLTLIDLENIQWSEQGRLYAEKRMSIFSVDFNASNRAILDLNEFMSAVKNSYEKSENMEFKNFFFGKKA